MSALSMPRTEAIRPSSSSSTGPSRSTGGAANARPSAVWRRVTSPARHCCTTVPAWRGAPPASSQAWHVPRVGWPAKGSSATGVKIRTW